MVSKSPTAAQTHVFKGIKIVEYADYPSGEMLSQLMGEAGGDVVKVEPLDGAQSRKIGPFVNNKADPNKSLNYWYYNTNKKSVTLDVADKGGRSKLDALLKDADFFVCTLSPREAQKLGFDYDAMQKQFPRLIIVSITDYGLTGPWKDYQSSDLVALAGSGPLWSCGYDDHSIPPIRPGGNQGYHTAMSHAYIGALLALIEREQTGQGQLVDVAMHDTLAVGGELMNPQWYYTHTNLYRQTCRTAMPTLTQPTLFQCLDGYVYYLLIIGEDKHWSDLVRWLDSHGLAGDLTDPKYSSLVTRQQSVDHIQGIIESFFMMHPKEQMYREGQQFLLPVGVLNAPEDLLEDPHFQERAFFTGTHYEGVGEVVYPGEISRYSAFDAATRTPAPKLGADNDAVLGKLVAGA